MATFTVRPEGIIRTSALSMPGNATGSEAACTSLTASQIRTLLSLATTSDVTFDIVRATTSVLTPLVNNASAALTLGNSTHGVTVPGAMGIYSANTGGKQLEVNGTGDIYLRSSAPTVQYRVSVNDQAYATYYSSKFRIGTFDGLWRESFIIEKSAPDNSLVISSAGNSTFTGDISMAKTSAQGYVYAYGTGGTNYLRSYCNASHEGLIETNAAALVLFPYQGFAQVVRPGFNATLSVYDSSATKYSRLTHDGTNGILSTSSGALVLSPATSIIGIGGITSAYPAIKRSSTTAAFRLGDDSADAPISCAGITASNAVTVTKANATGILLLAGAASRANYGLGRTAEESAWAICSAPSQYITAATTGDTCITSNGTIRFGVYATGADAPISCAGITASGNVSYAQGLSTGTVTKSANYTTTANDYCVNVTANSIDITFETAVGCANREHEVINSGSGVVTLKTTSAQTISGSASGALTLAQWKSIRVKSDGANWLIMSQIT